ncbi:prenyltransferase/squalene oxidase repeat-containing protein [Streptomyces sp. NPDC002564]|uniref:prenyltransferase/squalene oxidase repeat-containing protein n=1 Tax=Streptomyces sp. NPDC002564 TaxID=3364649 RepID=UPI0036B273E1
MQQDTEVVVSLLLMDSGADVFYILGGNDAKRCLELRLEAQRIHRDGLAATLVASAQHRFGIDLRYVGIIRIDDSDPGPTVHVATAVNNLEHATTGREPLSRYQLADLSHLTGNLPPQEVFAYALEYRAASVAAHSLQTDIDVSFEKSIAFLNDRACAEAGMRGWNQYQDDSRVGVISTAQALLCHSYARTGDPLVQGAAQTLADLQNPDGGWQVRRALVGAPSSVSITESTALCLTALKAAGRSAADPTVQKGLAWLEGRQTEDGGWKTSASVEVAGVFPTAWATRVAVSFQRGECARRGAGWLRGTQNNDGGWGPVGQGRNTNDTESNSSPAYTAHAVLALIAQGVTVTDACIAKAGDYLRAAFDFTREEPWVPTSFTALIDADTHARLDFRHFATPWVLAALAEAGHDLSDRMLRDGTRSLLRMQTDRGAWRNGLTAPGDYPVWACHDALFALRNVSDVGARRMDALIETTYVQRERRVLEESFFRAISTGPSQPPQPRSSYLATAWMSLLTVAVALLILLQLGILEPPSGGSRLVQALKWLGAAVGAALAALAPPILVEEYKMRRQRRDAHPQGSDHQ